MLDIELQEVFPSDKVCMTRGSGVLIAEFMKETKCHLYFKFLKSTVHSVTKEFIFYVIKGSGNDNVLKL